MDIERYNFWNLEMRRLELAVMAKKLNTQQLHNLEDQRKSFLEKGSCFQGMTIDYYDKGIDTHLGYLHNADKAIREELALYNVN